MRILIAGILGAIAMFVWMSIAHLATPLATIGFSRIHHEDQLMSAMRSAVDDGQGLYFYPWMDPKDPNAMKAQEEKLKTQPQRASDVQSGRRRHVADDDDRGIRQRSGDGPDRGFPARPGHACRLFRTRRLRGLIGLAAALTTNVSYLDLVWISHELHPRLRVHRLLGLRRGGPRHRRDPATENGLANRTPLGGECFARGRISFPRVISNANRGYRHGFDLIIILLVLLFGGGGYYGYSRYGGGGLGGVLGLVLIVLLVLWLFGGLGGMPHERRPICRQPIPPWLNSFISR
jgi:hypothetical protein